MNKTVKLISTLLIAIMLVASLSQIVLANDASAAIGEFKDLGYKSSELESANVTSIAKKIVIAIRNIAVIVAVIMISVLGVQYMIGSAEQKASYKKSFIPLIVGAVLVVAATQIATMLFSIG